MLKYFWIPLLFIALISCSDYGVDPVPHEVPTDESPAWSPDGKWIAYWHHDPTMTDTMYPTGLYLTDTTGKERTLVREGYAFNPDWNSLNGLLVFNADYLFTITMNGEDLQRITTFRGCHFPRWSPTDNLISFGKSGTQDSVGIWFLNNSNNEFVRWGFGSSPADWSPTGEHFVYQGPPSSDGGGNQIWISDTAGLNQLQLTTNSFATNRYPAWSPDGENIAWSVTGKGIDHPDIWMMNADGTAQQRITDGAYPSWSPDSKKLVFMKPVADQSKGVLWFINLETMQITQLTD